MGIAVSNYLARAGLAYRRRSAQSATLAPAMPLALATGTSVLIFLGAYALIVLIAFIAWPRDVQGRRRALGCSIALVIFFGMFVAAFGAWAAHGIF